MSQTTLYLMLGYPGAGKTTVARKLAETSGAELIWADHERRTMFTEPSHTKAESDALYARLNHTTDTLLSEGKSVIFDTNFNYYKDREYLRKIAKKHGAQTVLIWLTTPKKLAEQRAVHESVGQETRVLGNMTHADFKRIASHLEPPRPNEPAIEIDGSDISESDLQALLPAVTSD
jgi:predicted kinase